MLELFKRKAKKEFEIPLPLAEKREASEKKEGKVRITIIDYDEAKLQEEEANSVDDCIPFKQKPTVTWIKVDGIHQPEIINRLGALFDIHPLILEDIVSTQQQRPKIEDFGDYIFIVLKMFYYNEANNEITAEQFSLIFSRNFVITFEEIGGDVFNLVRGRIKNEKAKIRRMGTDYLAYVLLDAIVDNYFIILERLGETLEELEAELVTAPSQEKLEDIYELKSSMIFLRKSVWPLREVVSRIERGESNLIHRSTSIYFKDLYDHTIQVIDTIEIYREMLTEMMSIHLSSISNRMNEIMKVLTVITTIFIPLSFISSIFSMNFEHMPELQWEYGYQFSLFLMAMVGVSMVSYFWRKKWL